MSKAVIPLSDGGPLAKKEEDGSNDPAMFPPPIPLPMPVTSTPLSNSTVTNKANSAVTKKTDDVNAVLDIKPAEYEAAPPHPLAKYFSYRRKSPSLHQNFFISIVFILFQYKGGS
jgi:hypothetical protein